MKLELTKLTPKIEKRNIYAYVDINVFELKLKLKGIKVIFEKGEFLVHMPTLPIEGSKFRYSPILFYDDEFLKDLRSSIIELILRECPLSSWENGVYIKQIV
jgi:hypothetical protein